MRTREEVAAIFEALGDKHARCWMVAGLKAEEKALRDRAAELRKRKVQPPYKAACEVCADCYEIAADELERAWRHIEKGYYP